MDKYMRTEDIENFLKYMLAEEKSKATLEKYERDIRKFLAFSDGCVLVKELVLDYKKMLTDAYQPASVNSMLAALNAFFSYMGWYDLRVKQIRIQRQSFCPEEKELSKEEYFRLVSQATKNGNERLALLLQTICATGIRVSELTNITVEAVRTGKAVVRCKGKMRTVLLTNDLKVKLLSYAKRQGIHKGILFCTRSGRALSRNNIWRDMKNLCQQAGVSPEKVFPHNLRHLFARAFYAVKQDIAKLADILGHSNVNTTRIYIRTTGKEHEQQLSRLGLLWQNSGKKIMST